MKFPHIPFFYPKLPEALTLAREQLSEAKRDYLTHAHAAEYHAAMRDMIEKRADRLQDDLTALETEHTESRAPKAKLAAV